MSNTGTVLNDPKVFDDALKDAKYPYFYQNVGDLDAEDQDSFREHIEPILHMPHYTPKTLDTLENVERMHWLNSRLRASSRTCMARAGVSRWQVRK